MPSSVPRVKAAALDMLATALPDVAANDGIWWAHPGDDLQYESVWLGDAREPKDEPRIGNRTHYETFILPIVVWILQPGDDQRAVEERWWYLVSKVEDALRADGPLGGVAGLLSAVVVGKEPHGYTDGARGGAAHEGAVLVLCKARI